MSDDDKKVTAYHEAGHALVAIFTEGSDPLHKVTIIPRGRALGVTMQLPTEDKHNYRSKYVEGRISILMGGRVAEELTQDDITTGAGNDIERATDLARRMVCEWGMSKLGPLSYGSTEEPVFLGRDFSQRPEYSQQTAEQIDREVQRLVQDGYHRAKALLERYRSVLDRVALDLLEHESLDGEAVYRIIQQMTGENLAPPPTPKADAGPPAGPTPEPARPEPQSAGIPGLTPKIAPAQ
jgi:cell division protease FtsH